MLVYSEIRLIEYSEVYSQVSLNRIAAKSS